jgi:hypothetical protein
MVLLAASQKKHGRMDNQLLLLQKIFIDLNELPEAQYEQHLSQLTEEQPYLMGFLFNLDEDLEEDKLGFVLHSALVLSQVFKTLTYPMEIVDEKDIEAIIMEQSALFEKYFTEHEDLTFEGLFAQCTSPDTVAALFFLLVEEFGDEVLDDEPASVISILNITVALFEQAVEKGMKPSKDAN